ncbi:MAG TPA: integration host factor [Firmicutes bacterium]|nr:integration host factor [Bacillota bacterium]
MSLPKLTAEEKLQALEKAQSMRKQRAQIREQLKSGKLTLRDVLNQADDEVVGRMRVSYLLQSLPQIGKVTSRRIMEEIGIHENRRVQGLGPRQIDALLKKLG